MMPDAFKDARQAHAVLRVQIGAQSIPMLLTYKGVREAAKNWQLFSSDAPFRVPIPSEEKVRTVRQLPIEADPPLHRQYRDLIEPFFRRPMQQTYVDRLEKLVGDVMDACASRREFDVVRDFALPIQSRALALLLGVPAGEAETWISWGVHVFHDGADPKQQGARLERYLLDCIRAGADAPDDDNFFSALNRFRIDDRALTDVEKLGIANLVFAGGRDTVINTIAFIVAHFAEHPRALVEASSTPMAINLAVEECVRVVSPLTHIGRVCKHDVPAIDAKSGETISLCWAAANYDRAIFSDPEHVNLARAPNPHVGFGSGHHMCLGAPQARAILRSLVRVLAEQNRHISIKDAVPNYETFGEVKRQVGFKRLIVAVTPAA